MVVCWFTNFLKNATVPHSKEQELRISEEFELKSKSIECLGTEDGETWFDKQPG